MQRADSFDFVISATTMSKSGIKREDIIAWGGADVFNQGLAIVNAGDVLQVRYDPATRLVSGKIDQPNGWEMPVSFVLLEGGGIRSKCPCYTNQKLGQVCCHITAIAIALSVTEMDDIPTPSPKSSSTAAQTSEPTPDEDFIEVPMQPKFGAFVMGSRASLSIEVDAYYGDIDIPACSFQPPDVVRIPDPDDPTVRRVRSLKAEKAAVALLTAMGFEAGYREGDLKYYITSPQKVLNFLGKGYPELRRRGWTVDLAPKLSALYDSFRSIVPVVSIRDAGNDFYVGYEFDAQGTDVSPVEIQAAINRGDGYLLKDENIYLFDATAVEHMHDVFRDCAATQGNAPAGFFRVKGIYAPYVKASLDTMCESVELEDDGANHWRSVAAQTGDPAAKYEPVSLGALDGVLRPYQKQGVYWMRFLENAGHCGLLADEMGLGKTLQTLTWLSLPRNSDASGKAPALIVCPTSLVMNWAAEAAKFIPSMKVLVISGPDRAACFPRIPEADLVVTSYALLQRDFDAAYAEREFAALVIDEAQHIKNRQTKNALAVKAVNARQRLALTGTPIENSVADAWSIFDFLMPDYLGDYETFKADFEDPIASRGDEDSEAPALAQDALERLKRKIQPFIMRRVKKSVAKDLPDKIVKVSRCPMSDDFQREYNDALAKTRSAARDAVRDKGFAKARFEILAMLMKLRQIASRAKLDSCLEVLISAIEGGHKILVFSQFVKMLTLLREELAKRGIRHCYLDGSTKDRLGECNRFNRSPDIPVFLISLMAGGTGLNLTGADMVMHYDPWWNPAVEDQATDRAHRIGQKKTVYVMKMIAAGSIEEKVLALQRRKQAIIAATVDTTDAAVMESLTAADLNDLLG